MPPQKLKPVAKSGINAPIVSVSTAFDALCRHLRESGKEDDGVILLPEAAKCLRGFLQSHRKNDTSIEEKFVTGLVAALEDEDGNICRRLDGMTFTIIVEAILQTDSCRVCERGLYLLAASLHQDTQQLRGKKRKEEIASMCLNLLFAHFVDVDGPPETRRWIGILGIQLLKGSSKNTSRVGIGPDRIRRGLGQMLRSEENEIVKGLAGKIIDLLRSAGTPLPSLWPAGTAEEEYVNFPRSSQDGWSQQFQEYIDTTCPLEEGQEPKQLLCFATDCYLKPSLQFGCVGHTVYITLDTEILTVHAPSSEYCPDQVLDIPIKSVSKIILRGETETRSGIAAGYFLLGPDTPLCIMNGMEEDVSSVRIRGLPNMVHEIVTPFREAFPGILDDDADTSELDSTDDETNGRKSPIFKSYSREAMVLGSEAGSDFPLNNGYMEHTPTAPEFNNDDDLYDASPRKTNTTQSPDELDHTRESHGPKKKDNSNIEEEGVASQSTSQGRSLFGKKGTFPSKPKSQAQAHIQDQIEHEEPVAVPKAKPVEASRPKTGPKSRISSHSKKPDEVRKEKSEAKSQIQDETEDLVAVQKSKVAAKSKPKTSTQSKVGSQPKQPNNEVQKNTSQANKRGRAEVGEPAPKPKTAVKSKPETGTQEKAASQSKKLDPGAGKRTSRSNPQTETEIDEAVSKTKPAAKSKLHTDKQSKADSQFNKARVLAKAEKIASQSKSQTTTGRKNVAPKIKPKAKAPIILPKSQQNKASAPTAQFPDSESFQVSDEHNASTPKPSQAVKNKTIVVGPHTKAERTKDQKGKKVSKVPRISKGNTAGDEYDLLPSSDDEDFDPKQKKSSKVKKGSAMKYGKARTKKVVPQQMELFDGYSSSKKKLAPRGRPGKSATTEPSQLGSENEIEDLGAPPPRKNPPRKSQEAKEPENPPKVRRASKIPVARGKTEKVPLRKAEPPVQFEDKHDEITPAPIKRKSRQAVIEPDEADYEEPPMAGFGDDDNAAGVSLPHEVQNPDGPEVLLNQSQPKTTEKSQKSAKRPSPKEIADKMSHIFDEALVENSPELRPHADLVGMEIDQLDQEPLHDPMDVLDNQNDLGKTHMVQFGSKNVSSGEFSMASGDSKVSRKRKAEIEEPEPAKKRRSYIQEDAQNISSQQNVDAQTYNGVGKANKPASEYNFKKPAVPRNSEAKKVNPFLEPQAKPIGINEESPLNANLDTPAAKGREGSVVAAGEQISNAPLVDDSVHRKANLIAFNKSGPMNSGRLSATPKSHVEAIVVSSSAKKNQPVKKRKLDKVEQVDVGSPPSKRQQSSPVQQEDEAMVDSNFGDFGDIDNGLARSSSPAPTSPAAALIVPRKRHSSQPSRVDENGSPLPLGVPVFCDHMGIDGRIKEPSQPKDQDIPVVPGPFKANQLFGTKAQIGSQNKARPESPENFELRYIPHQKTKSGNYEGVVGKEVVQPEQLADPFTEPHTRKSSGFTERLRSESKKPGGVNEQPWVIPKPQAIVIGNSFGASSINGRTQPVADIQTGKAKKKDVRLAIGKIQAALPETDEYAAKQALLVCGGGVDEAINALVASRATKRSSKKPQVFTHDPEKTLVGGGIDVTGMTSGSSSEDSNSDPVRSPLQEMSSNETWNVAMRPHYANLKDAVHRVADEMIIRLANEEDQMGLLVKQYQEGGAKIVDDLVQKRTEEKAQISKGLMTKKSAMVKAYEASNKAIAKVVEATRKNPVSQFAEGWKARQVAIREKIRKGKGAD